MASEKQRLSRPGRVLIVDDHPLVRDGIRLRIQGDEGFVVCGEAADIGEALNLLQQTAPDIAIVDISLKEGNGLDLVKRMLARQPSPAGDRVLHARGIHLCRAGLAHRRDGVRPQAELRPSF